MLTRDLLRFKKVDKTIEPQFLKPTPAVRRISEDLLGYWRAGVGRKRQELEEGSGRVCYRARSLVVARGLQKLVVDACTFTEPDSVAEVRWRALTASAARLQAGPDRTSDEHRQTVETELGETELDRLLYADLPHEAVLEETPGWSAEELIARYNRALVQGLILGAGELTVAIEDPDTGIRRRIVKQLRFHCLLAEVSQGRDGVLRLKVSGPGSVLDQANRYGLQLALFLPAVASAGTWRVEAQIAKRGRQAGGQLVLTQADPIPGDERFLAYVPEDLRGLCDKLRAQRPAWTWTDDAPLSTIAGGNDLIVPDLRVNDDEGQYCDIEFFHRWHAHPLQRRLQQCAKGLAPHLALGVDRTVAKKAEIAEAIDQAGLGERVFLFSSYPAPRALLKAVTTVFSSS